MGPDLVSAHNVDPTQWPAVPGLDPFIETTAHSIRFAGPDRYQTNLALNLALRGKGDFPFDTPDPTSDGAANLAAADDWWGAGTCPRSILVVAGDTFADALAAASLSDPSDRSDQPRVQRVAASDPLFDPIGGFDRVDTAFAPIVVTGSARSGATALAQTARLTASDFARGGCTTAREAIIVGGTNAVPVGVASELIELGYREVFRVSGVDRYDTAARVATAMGTGTPPPADTPCTDPDVTDGDARLGWYGNAAPEFRLSATQCQILPRTVVLADGFTGADALAAGWWTSYWQVPVLLTAPDGSLPPATRTALQTLNVNSIVVLGGLGRIPEETVIEAKALSGAVAGRIAGPDRYATSVEMAKQFGGWYPTGEGADFEGDMVCLAASSGLGADATGWPDALALGPWCGRKGAEVGGSPQRALPPVPGAPSGLVEVGGAAGRHAAVPIVLVPPAADLPSSVSGLLAEAFAPEGWCTAASAAGCLHPGFAAVAGGRSVVSQAAVAQATDLVGGGTSQAMDVPPAVGGTFLTRLNMAPVFDIRGSDALTRICQPRGELRAVRWLTAHRGDGRALSLVLDLLDLGIYSPGPSQPICVQLDPLDAETVSLRGTSTSGVRALSTGFPLSVERSLGLSGPLNQSVGLERSDAGFQLTTSGFRSGPQLTTGRSTRPLVGASLSVDLRHGEAEVASFTGTIRLNVEGETVTGSVVGEALLEGDIWRLRGRASLLRLDGLRYLGGFSTDVRAGDATSGEISWLLDGHAL